MNSFSKTVLLILISVISNSLKTFGEYTEHRREILGAHETYDLRWSIDLERRMVQFDITVETGGFIGFGISPTGGMAKADIYIGGVYSNGTAYLKDYHGVGETTPVEDKEQNVNLVGGSWNGTHTNIIFTRSFDTCDEEDMALSNDTTHFIWAYSSSSSDDITYHGSSNRGSVTVQPLDPEVPPVDLSTYSTYNITHMMTMPQADTTYWCTIHKSPTFSSKNHIVAFEPLLKSPEAKAHTHHYNIFRCTAPAGTTPEAYFEKFIGHEGGECYVENPVMPVHNCQTMFYNWAVGGKMLILPETIGYPIGESGHSVDYYMFEIHYNNPDELGGVNFETGVTVYYTNDLRDQDAGLMVVAHHTSISLTVPPKSAGYLTVGHCDPICTRDYLPEDGINVFAIFLHAHLSGRKMKFRQFRGAEELPWAASDDTYDFDFQQTRPLSKELKVLRGDHLTMECTYDTMWREGTTVGGLSTRDEMCQAIFWYYPRAELRDCRSEYPIEKLFAKFGIESANRSTMYEDAIITAPPKYAGQKYTQVLNNAVDWNCNLRNEIQQDSVSERHVGVCWTDTVEKKVESTGYPVISQEFKPARYCDNKATTTKAIPSLTCDSSNASAFYSCLAFTYLCLLVILSVTFE